MVKELLLNDEVCEYKAVELLILFCSPNTNYRKFQVKVGLAIDVMCVLVCNLMINTLGVALFDVKNFPQWANTSAIDEKIMGPPLSLSVFR